MDFSVEVESSGRAGNIIYTENGQSLKPGWELTMNGTQICAPTTSMWDDFCEREKAEWAKGRRREILERVAEETRRQKCPSARAEIDEYGVELIF